MILSQRRTKNQAINKYLRYFFRHPTKARTEAQVLTVFTRLKFLQHLVSEVQKSVVHDGFLYFRDKSV